jgi:hypothetical protein
MNCPNCNGNGRFYTQVAGGWLVLPCSCEQSMKLREIKEQEKKNFEKRLIEAEIAFGLRE